MQYARLGRSGLEVSRLCLGGMSFGIPERGGHPWTLAEDASSEIIKHALELGVNFFDTANVYSDGTSEQIVGRALAKYARREDVVISAKVGLPTRAGPNSRGLSRKVIFSELSASLERLGTDYIDLYQIHRWDDFTPIEETLGTLNDLIAMGKIRYIGASSMAAWQFSRAISLSTARQWNPFLSMQNHYNLLYREEEREMIPLCTDQLVSVLPWSPLARGLLARPWGEKDARSDGDPYRDTLYTSADRTVVEEVTRVASSCGVPMAQVAFAWLVRRPGVTAPVVGVTELRQLDDAVAALSLELPESALSELDLAYSPHPTAGIEVLPSYHQRGSLLADDRVDQ